MDEINDDKVWLIRYANTSREETVAMYTYSAALDVLRAMSTADRTQHDLVWVGNGRFASWAV